jgi:VIT1/CCC1 family predicted Fe2+/Mn2+ transporter
LSEIFTEEQVIEIAKSALKDELEASFIYGKLSSKFTESEITKRLSEISHMEDAHATFWRSFLNNRAKEHENVEINESLLSIYSFLYGLLGIGLGLKILEASERKIIEDYIKLYDSKLLSDEEKTTIKQFLNIELEHEEELNEYEDKYKFFINRISTISSQLNGGLVIVLSTAIGLSGIYTDPIQIGLSGLILGITSSLGTLVGFYFFGKTQKVLKQDILDRLKLIYKGAPEAYFNRAIKYMEKREYSEDLSKNIVEEIHSKNNLDKIIAEEEYGIKEDSLGDPMKSAIQAGIIKIIGTLFPLFPFLMGLPVNVSILLSIFITLILLTIVGSIVAIAAEVSIRKKIIELTTGGLVLSGLSFILGKLTGFLLNIF